MWRRFVSPPAKHFANYAPIRRVVSGMQHLLRRLRRSPLFACVTLATLAIGIGANTAIFSVLDGILLRPLPYAHSEQLIAVTYDAPGVNLHSVGTAPFLYFIYAEQNRTL